MNGREAFEWGQSYLAERGRAWDDLSKKEQVIMGLSARQIAAIISDNEAEERNLEAVIEQLTNDGISADETLAGLFSVSGDLFDAGGKINDEYCWMHRPGDWCCRECAG